MELVPNTNNSALINLAIAFEAVTAASGKIETALEVIGVKRAALREDLYRRHRSDILDRQCIERDANLIALDTAQQLLRLDFIKSRLELRQSLQGFETLLAKLDEECQNVAFEVDRLEAATHPVDEDPRDLLAVLRINHIVARKSFWAARIFLNNALEDAKPSDDLSFEANLESTVRTAYGLSTLQFDQVSGLFPFRLMK